MYYSTTFSIFHVLTNKHQWVHILHEDILYYFNITHILSKHAYNIPSMLRNHNSYRNLWDNISRTGNPMAYMPGAGSP